MRTFRVILGIAGIGLMAGGLGGCDQARQALGYDKSSPDEFKVVRQAPLSLPPDYELRPPRPGEKRPQAESQRDTAKRALLGSGNGGGDSDAEGPRDLSPGGRALLERAGAVDADSDIRRTVDRETASAEADTTFFTERLMFWEDRETGEVVDAEKESRRLQENQALGKSVTEGDTPTIKRKPKALLEDVF